MSGMSGNEGITPPHGKEQTHTRQNKQDTVASDENDKRSGAQVEKPLAFKYLMSVPEGCSFRRQQTALLEFMTQQQWSYLIARRFWTFGYRTSEIVEIFEAVPSELKRLIGKALNTCQHFCYSCHGHTSSNSAHVVCQEPCTMELKRHCFDNMLRDGSEGILQTTYCPKTQMRISFTANSQSADLLGMHGEEILARLAQCDLPLLLPPLDAVCVFLDCIARTMESSSTRYYRMLLSGGTVSLVRTDSSKAFNTQGQIYEVCSMIIYKISSTELVMGLVL